MANFPNDRIPPLSIRLTTAERALLEKKAGGQSLSSYIKNEVFGGPGGAGGPGLGLGLTIGVTRRARPEPRLLAQILAKLGDGGLALSMADLAEAARIGTLYVDDEIAGQLRQACDDIAEVRLLLLEALGKRRRPVQPTPKNLTEAFNLAVSGAPKPRASELKL